MILWGGEGRAQSHSSSHCWERGCQRAGQSPENFPTNKIFLPHIPRLGAEVFHPLNSGSSLFPMGEQTKPILSSGGIDRSWASSRDESLRERLRLIVSARGFLGPAHRRQVIAVCDQQTPPLTPETISRRAAPTFRHLAKLISGFLLWPCLKRIARARERPGAVPCLGFGQTIAFTLSPTGNSEEPDFRIKYGFIFLISSRQYV